MANEYWLIIVMMEIFENWILIVVAQLWKYTNNGGTVQLMYMNFMICEFYLNKVFNK